jgi:hypothetical protein
VPFRSEPLRRHWFEPNGERAGNGDCQMGFAGAGAADQHDVALVSDEGAGCAIADQASIDWRVGEVKVVQILGQRELCDGALIADRPGLFLGDLGLQQVTDDAGWFVLALDAGGHDLVISTAHSIELEAAHQVEVEPVVRHRSENRLRGGAFHMCWSS